MAGSSSDAIKVTVASVEYVVARSMPVVEFVALVAVLEPLNK